MKKGVLNWWCLMLLVMVALSCGKPQVGYLSQSADIFSENGTPDEALSLITEKNLKDNLYYLASDELQGRGNGTPGNEKAAEFIINKFKEYGLTPGFSTGFLQKFSISSGVGYTSNVIGYLPGNDETLKKEFVVIGAHFDHLGMDSSDDEDNNNDNGDDSNDNDDSRIVKAEDNIYNGADDNGSGTVVVIEAAKALSSLKNQLKRSVLFIGFSAEELGLVGSSYYVRNPVFALKQSKYMINLDMVGYLRNGSLKFLGGASSQSASKMMKEICAKYPQINPYISQSAGGGSDHVPFINNGVPGVFMHTGSHENYHQVTDSAEKINYPGLTDIAKIAAELAWKIAQADQSPSNETDDVEITDQDWNYDHTGVPFLKN